MKNKIVSINKNASIAIYRQIISCIIDAIDKGSLHRGDKIPSINDIAKEFKLSRDTVLLAFNELKARGIISSMPGKGYYVESENVEVAQKVFLLFDELNAFKDELYNSFLEALPSNVQVDIFFHHFNKDVFESLIKDSISKYGSFVIMPGNLKGIASTLSFLPDDKVYIIDQRKKELEDKYPVIYQDFEGDLYQGLHEGLSLLEKYTKMVLLYPGGKEPLGFVDGFTKFCRDNSFDFEVISTLKNRVVKKGEVYLLLETKALVRLIKDAWSAGVKIGSELGIISINNYPLMEVVAGGITTISTDFSSMGKSLADMIIERKHEVVKNPSNLIIRNSL